MDTVASILASPRGRFFSATVGYRCSGDGLDPTCRPIGTLSGVLERLASVDLDRVRTLPELHLLDALGLATDFARYWQLPDEHDRMFARPDLVSALRPIVEAVLESPHAAWWNESVDLHAQHVTAKLQNGSDWSDTATEFVRCAVDLIGWRDKVLGDEARSRAFRVENPHRAVGGEWWSTPEASGVMETSRARDGLGAVQLVLEEDDISDGRRSRVWPVTVDGTPRVYEIGCPQDWAVLVDAYPLAVPECRRSDWFDTTGVHCHWNIPDWVAVSEDYDAVHLTVLGYLTTPGIAIPLAHRDGATLLAGWDPDVTYWLRDGGLRVDRAPTDWSRSGGRPWTQI
ncbi:hypothetical protein [Prescottella subtropica]|uniref:hypothetical protein n=1 Tax=Prescottella subtropica TaxID=2545757 RepID=UPI0010F43C94|nr:hypothetical protein [Prescottella subtropica]